MLNSEIYREYDIRGIAGKDMTEEDVTLLGRGIGTYLQQRGNTFIAVGRDCRVSSDAYAACLMAGLTACGCRVVDIGICPTPVSYFAIRHLQTHGSVMVTASHNPAEYNGFKMCLGSGSIHGEDIQKIRSIIENKAFVKADGGSLSDANVLPHYQWFVQENITIEKRLRIAVDAGNGTAGVVAVTIMKTMNLEVHDIYCEMDGAFPNHEADPTVLKNMKDLISPMLPDSV